MPTTDIEQMHKTLDIIDKLLKSSSWTEHRHKFLAGEQMEAQLKKFSLCELKHPIWKQYEPKVN